MYSVACIDINIDFSVDIESTVVLVSMTKVPLAKGVVSSLAESLVVSQGLDYV